VGEIALHLEVLKSSELFRKHIFWLARKDPEKSVSVSSHLEFDFARADNEQILISREAKSSKIDDQAFINELRLINQAAASRYLEHVVVAKRSTNKKLHEQLLQGLLTSLNEASADDGIKYHLEEMGKSHKLLPWCII
jgi:hypothetical protein